MLPAFLLFAAIAGTPDQNASEFPGYQGEVSIAVDPNAPARVLAAAMDIEDGRLLVMASSDSGDTWRRTQIPLSSGAAFHADPMVDFDSRGRAFLAHIPVAAGNHPVGIEVAHTDDPGAAFSPSVRLSRSYDRDDKVALEVDDHEESPFRDAVCVAWKWPSGRVFLSRSLDRGLTFEAPRAIDSARVTGLDMATDRDAGSTSRSFEPAVRLSSASSFSTSASFQYGDYQGLDAASGKAYAAWTDHRTSGASEIYVATLVDPPGAGWRGWSVRRGEGRVTLTYRGQVVEEVLADVYLMATRLRDGARSYLTASGFAEEESPFETRRLPSDFEVAIEMREDDLSFDLLLQAVVVPFGAPPSSPNLLSSPLAVWAEDLAAGRSIGCASEPRTEN
jgi:hypothetical protein